MSILNRLTINYLKKNKKRTIITIIGVILSTVLLFGIGLCISTVRENMLQETVRNEGQQHIILKDYPYSELQKLKSRKNIKITDYEVVYYEGEVDNYLKLKILAYPDYEGSINLFAGSYPKENEILISRDFYRIYPDLTSEEIKIGKQIIIDNKTYTISGIYDEATPIGYQFHNSYISDKGYLFTNFTADGDSKVNVRIQFQSLDNIYEQIKQLGLDLGYEIKYSGNTFTFDEIVINHQLLNLYGKTTDDGQNAVLFLSVLLLSTVLGIVCIFVIYNSFAISVLERKKMFGMFASIGATPKQLLLSVFFEAVIVGIIAIPIGIILSVGIVQFVLLILNTLLNDLIAYPYQLSFYPQYLLLSILFIVITLFLSALFPAKRASESTPISSIRLEKEITIKRKIDSKLIYKLFGVEGDLAYKNMKRNKRKYRVTTISICISIILFLTFSTYINSMMIQHPDEIEPDISISIENTSETDKIIEEIKQIPYIESSITFKMLYVAYQRLDKEYYNQDYYNNFLKDNESNYSTMFVYGLDNDSYNNYIKKYGLDKKAFLYNQGILKQFDPNSEEIILHSVSVFNESMNPIFKLCERAYDENWQVTISSNCIEPTYDIEYTNKSPFHDYNISGNPGFELYVNEDLYQNMLHLNSQDNQEYQMYISSNQIKKFDTAINKIIEKYQNTHIQYYSAKLQRYEIDQMITAFRFALYSFILFIALIAITSAISTIYTSIQLRRREFAMLRSIGLSPKGLRKILCLESLFFGIKSLLYGLIISFGIIYLLQQISNLSYSENKMTIPFPTTYVIICIVGVFLIVFVAMTYSTRKIKYENIIDETRQENM